LRGGGETVLVVEDDALVEDASVHHGRLDPGILLLAKPYRRTDLARMIRRALDTPAAGDGPPEAETRKSA
jgi:hypothetical protein